MDTTINDFYTHWDKNKPDALTQQEYRKSIQGLTEEEMALMQNQQHYYQLSF